MNRLERRSKKSVLSKYLNHRNNAYSDTFQRIPLEEWPYENNDVTAVWRNRDYLVQVYRPVPTGEIRLSVCRTALDSRLGWAQDISWESLQQIKQACGFGGMDAVEVYPADEDVVNVSNMRHIWIIPGRLPFVWRRYSTSAGN